MTSSRLLLAVVAGISVLLFGLSWTSRAEAQIEWQSWGDQAFERAARENKLIFVDVGTEWCSACNSMAAGSYRNRRVQELLAEHFIAIHVDAEAEPDVGERYGFWGWPALVFMTPKGEHVHFVRGFMIPKDFIWLLDLLTTRFAKGELKEVDFTVDLARRAVNDPLDKMIKTSRAALDNFYDTDHDGWGRPKMPFHDLVQQALWRGRTSSSEWLDRAITTAKKTAKLVDPVWGGVFFGAASLDWTNLIYERRTEHQASAIFMFAEAYAATGETRWLSHAQRAIDLLDGNFKTPDGTYYTSQEQELESGEISPAAYFGKSDAERRALGLPPIDTTIYADINAKLALALARLFEASRDESHLARALTIGERLLAAHTKEGWIQQILRLSQDGKARIRSLAGDVNTHSYLRAQAFTGLAYLRLYRSTGDARWFDAARGLAGAMMDKLWYEPGDGPGEKTGAAFLGSSRRVYKPDGKIIFDRPLVDNGAAAEFLIRLATYGNGRLERAEIDLYLKRAELALRGTSDAELMKDNGRFIGQHVLALHALRDEFIEVTVVCRDTRSGSCRKLHRVALHDVNHVRKLVTIEEPGRYPDAGQPSAFVCTSKLCSNPMLGDDPVVANKMTAFMARLDQIASDTGK